MANSNVHEFGDTNFETEVLQAEVPVLVDFWASWCAPCRMIAPHVEAIAEAYAGRAKVGKVDVDGAPATAQKYGVMSIPTLIVFKDGKAVDQVVGAMPRENIQAMLDRAL